MTAARRKDFVWRRKPKGKHPPLDKLFAQMWKGYDNYIALVEDDLPFWSTEWNLVGHISVAASKFGPVTLEYSDRKPRQKKTRRPDAWFRFSDKVNDKGLDTLLEAKRDRLSLGAEAQKIYEYAEEYLQECEDYLDKFNDNDSSWTAAVFFLQIYSPHEENKEEYQKSIATLVKRCEKTYKKLSKRFKRPFWAYYFLKHDQLGKSKAEDEYYPGIIIFGDLRRSQAES